MTNHFSVSVVDLQAVTGFGRARVRTLINRPYPLSYEKQPSAPNGGNRTRLYRIDELLARLREHKAATEEMISNLITADTKFRNKE